MNYTSKFYRLFLKSTRDAYFDVMHDYKLNKLDPALLSNKCISNLKSILDFLCYIMNSFTEKEISACIKLIAYPDADDEVIDINNAELVTFCRSTNSQDRGTTDKDTVIRLKEKTYFLEILDKNNKKDYFYQGNLLLYDESARKIGRTYHNSNEKWQEYYIGTLVVPIRIEFKLLYHQKKNDAYHIIGFLCIDSLDPDAFTSRQERYNVDVVRSFADAIYILLSQYRHYLAKFEKEDATKDLVLSIN